MPTVLYNQLKGGSIASMDTIMVNSYIDWNSSRSIIKPVSNGDNLITAFMRHLAHMFGFGTSLDYRLGGLGFMVGGKFPSVFDKLVVNDEGRSLISLANGGASKIEEYMKQRLLLKTNSALYNLYSDTHSYVQYRSGNYFSLDKDNLMNYPYRDATEKLTIDSEVLDVLNSIGWTINNDNNRIIKSNNMDAFGYGSAYAPFIFNLYNDSGIENSNDIEWTFQLFSNMQDKYINISSKRGISFAVNQANIQSDYLDKFGLEHGRIVAEMNGKRYTQLLFLESRPCLTGCKITYKGDTEPDFYGVDVELSYLGAKKGYVYVYNDFGVTSFDYEFSGENRSIIYIPDVLKFGKSTLEITLQNEFGESNQSVQLNFSQNNSGINNEPLSVRSKQAPVIEGKMYVYNFQGVCVLVTDNMQETLSLPQGYYIVRSKDVNSKIIHIK